MYKRQVQRGGLSAPQGEHHPDRASALGLGDALKHSVYLGAVQISFDHIVRAGDGEHTAGQDAAGPIQKHPLIRPQPGLIPVSYTHLDVYKRQTIHKPFSLCNFPRPRTGYFPLSLKHYL